MPKTIRRWAFAVVFTAFAIACGAPNQTSGLSEDTAAGDKQQAETASLCSAKGIPTTVQARVPGQGPKWFAFQKQKQGETASECVVLYSAKVGGQTLQLANYYDVADGLATLAKSTGAGQTKQELDGNHEVGASPEKVRSIDDCPTEC